jgi:hypothetical protein
MQLLAGQSLKSELNQQNLPIAWQSSAIDAYVKNGPQKYPATFAGSWRMPYSITASCQSAAGRKG